MIIKLKKRLNRKIIRVQSQGEIKEILIREDFLNPKGETISICFKGLDNSGILELNAQELNSLCEYINSKTRLVKDIKRIN